MAKTSIVLQRQTEEGELLKVTECHNREDGVRYLQDGQAFDSAENHLGEFDVDKGELKPKKGAKKAPEPKPDGDPNKTEGGASKEGDGK